MPCYSRLCHRIDPRLDRIIIIVVFSSLINVIYYMYVGGQPDYVLYMYIQTSTCIYM